MDKIGHDRTKMERNGQVPTKISRKYHELTSNVDQGDADDAITSESEMEPVSTDENALASEGDLQPRFHRKLRPEEEEISTQTQDDEELPDPEAGIPEKIHEVSHKHVQTPTVARFMTETLPGTSSSVFRGLRKNVDRELSKTILRSFYAKN